MFGCKPIVVAQAVSRKLFLVVWGFCVGLCHITVYFPMADRQKVSSKYPELVIQGLAVRSLNVFGHFPLPKAV